jgi:MFS family permease
MTTMTLQRAPMLTRPVLATVGGHFGAAFAALCMPPFYAHILQASFAQQAPSLVLAGWYFTLPTLAAAIASPVWGWLADRIGRRALLMRAHAGLCLGFIVTGLARTPLEYALGLTVQGLLGGTFSASNAFLADLLPASRLATVLTVMQGSARAALFAGPALVGLLEGHVDLLRLFLYLALLPGAACALLWLLPGQVAHAATQDRRADGPAHGAATVTGQLRDGVAPPHTACGISAASLYWLQALFTIGTALSYPYFVTDLADRLHLGAATAGMLFGLPHAVFLLLAWPLGRRLHFANAAAGLAGYTALTCAGLLFQLLADGLAWLVTGRLLMGAGMTGACLAINALAAATVRNGRAGRHFGQLEGANKWGGVAAGLLASALVAPLGYAAPMWLGCLLLASLFISLKWKLS